MVTLVFRSLFRKHGSICYNSTARNFCSIVEQWTGIQGYANYQISSLGNIKNIKRSKFLYITYDNTVKTGRRKTVVLYQNGIAKSFSLNRLVLSSFHPVANQCELQANHIDGNPSNNALDNLEWMTPRENVYHSYRIGLRKSRKEAVILIVMESNEKLLFESMKAALEFINVKVSVTYPVICNWCKAKAIRHGYQFIYQNHSKYETTVADKPNEKWEIYFEGKFGWKYFVSNLGRLKILRKDGTERLCTAYYHRGYYYTYVQKRQLSLHRLVAIHFVHNPNGHPCVDHIDGNIANNEEFNLRWVTHKQNSNNPVTKEKMVQEMLKSFRKREALEGD